MPSFMGKKITRAEESARHAYRRALEKSLRAQAKGTGWKSAYGSIFREEAGWFIAASASVYIFEPVTELIVDVKPMAIDPIFWDIVGLPENRKQPLSFRANGAWGCHPPCFAELAIVEDKDPAIVGERLFIAAVKQLEKVTLSYSLEDFLSSCLEASSVDGVYLASIVAVLVALHREDEALAICENARSQGLGGGFLGPAGSFVDMAIDYLRRPAVRTCGESISCSTRPQ